VRHQRAGDSEIKMLSSGQRKRLNAGLDMIGISDVSPLRRTDFGTFLQGFRACFGTDQGLAHNKIVIVSIHQPSARLFQLFHKALLLDHGGKVALFGTPRQTLDYFRRVQREEQMTDAPALLGRCRLGAAGSDLRHPQRRRCATSMGKSFTRRTNAGSSHPRAGFSPAFWQDRFQTHRLMEEVHRERTGIRSATGQTAALPGADLAG